MLVDAHVDRFAAGNPSGAAGPFRLPPDILKPANRLLEQQFWLWGCDIRRQESNILLHLGFEKIKAPAATGLKTSQYRCPLSTTRAIALWGFGVCLCDSTLGSIFVPRAGLYPRWCQPVLDTATAWEPAWFGRIPLPATGREIVPCYKLVRELIDWIEWYEDRTLEIAGVAYRQRSLDARQRPAGDATDLRGQWLELGAAIRNARSLETPADDAGMALSEAPLNGLS